MNQRSIQGRRFSTSALLLLGLSGSVFTSSQSLQDAKLSEAAKHASAMKYFEIFIV
jgi:hypothetical protein